MTWILFYFLIPSVTFASFNGNECDYYRNESNALHCSDADYLMNFGYYYCNEFLAKQGQFTKQGQKVLSCIRPCLIDALTDAIDDSEDTGESITCKSVKPIAEQSHVGCYVHCGYCDMPESDKFLIDTIAWPEYSDPGLKSAMDQIGEECSRRNH